MILFINKNFLPTQQRATTAENPLNQSIHKKGGDGV
jgi:hypothetical protein